MATAVTRPIYDSVDWRTVSKLALERDGNRCFVSRLFGGGCSGVLHAHHIVAVEEGGAAFDLDNVGTTCEKHHPMWEAMRRYVMAKRKPGWKRCRHKHPYPWGREECERRLNAA